MNVVHKLHFSLIWLVSVLVLWSCWTASNCIFIIGFNDAVNWVTNEEIETFYDNDDRNTEVLYENNLKIDQNQDNKDPVKMSMACGPSPPRELKPVALKKKLTTSTGTSPPPQSTSTQVMECFSLIIIFLFIKQVRRRRIRLNIKLNNLPR